MNKKNNKKAFTLVELIVVMTILAILATVAFIYFGKYLTNSRDTVRISDVTNIKKTLELKYAEFSKYPTPDNYGEITYSGAIAWKQGSFGKDSLISVNSLSNIPIDPLTKNEYTYSVTEKGNEYEIGFVYELGSIALLDSKGLLTNSTYASKEDYTAYISGNYNGRILNTYNKIEKRYYILTIPTIINSSSSGNLVDIVRDKKLSFNGSKNIPSTYNIENTSNIFPNIINENKLVLYAGTTLYDLRTNEATQIEFVERIRNAYINTEIETDTNIKGVIDSGYTDLYMAQLLIRTYVDNNFEITASNIKVGDIPIILDPSLIITFLQGDSQTYSCFSCN